MTFTRAHYDLDAANASMSFGAQLGLKNLGASVHVFLPGEGFDYFHNHREQEEIYFCLQGTALLRIGGDQPQRVTLVAGDMVRVDPGTLRAIGNDKTNGTKAVVLITGACPHTYPAGIDHHDVIADVLSVEGRGQTGFTLPPVIDGVPHTGNDPDC